MRPLSIAILGGTGFVGLQLCSRLIRDGHALRVLTRNRDLHKELLVLPGLELVDADVHEQNVLGEAFRGCDVVINLVGILNEGGRSRFARVHAELAAKVVAACRSAGVPRLLHMSSLGADAAAPSAYLRSKGSAERSVREDAGPVRWTIFRPSVIFGPADRFVNRFAGLLRLSPLLPLARAEARLAPIFVGDVVEAFALALDDSASWGATLQLCGPEVMTLGQLVRCVRVLLGVRCALIPLPAPLGFLQALVFGLLPGKPFTLDNFRSLGVDSVCSEDGCARLGLEPSRFGAIVPAWIGASGRHAQLDAWRRAAGDRIGSA